MTALSLVAVDGELLDRPGDGPLTRAAAEALTTRGIAYREQAVDGLLGMLGVLAQGHAQQAHVALGLPTFHAWAEVVAGDLLALRLTSTREAVEVRQALVHSMRAGDPADPEGTSASYKVIAERLGVSQGSVRNDLRDGDPAPERKRSRDGSVRRSSTAVAPSAPLPAPEGPRWAQAAEWVRRAAEGLLPGRPAGGLTLGQLAHVAGWSEGAASGALNRAMRHGVVVRAEGKRGTVREHLPAEVEA